MDTKENVRHRVLEALYHLSIEQRAEWEQQLGALLLEECQSAGYTQVGLYVGKLPEYQTLPLIMQLQHANIQVYLPRVQPNRRLTFHLFESESTLEPGAYGILEPAESALQIEVAQLDILVVPGVAFNEMGERIGFGGGYYDRLLERENIETRSLVFPIQLLPQTTWQNEAHDIKIHKLLLPK